MAGRSGDGDLSRHLLITKSISIRITNPPEKNETKPTEKQKLSKRLLKHLPCRRKKPSTPDTVEEVPLPASVKVLFNGYDMTGKFQLKGGKKEKGGVTHHFALACDIPMFPDFNDDKLVFQLTGGEAGPKNFSLEYMKIAKEFESVLAKKAEEAKAKVQAQANANQSDESKSPPKPTEITITPDTTVKVCVTLHVVFGSIGVTDPTKLDSVTFVTAFDSKKMRAEALKSNFSNNRAIDDFVKLVDRAADAVAGFHPYSKVALAALSIPYKLMKNERLFNTNIQDLIDAILTTCKCLTDARYHVKVGSAKEAFMSIMKILRDAALHVDIYLDKQRTVQFIAAQFSEMLESFAKDLVAKKDDFLFAVIVQVAVDSEESRRMVIDNYLRTHLDPVKDQEHRDGCLENTRVNILKTVRGWLTNEGGAPKENILWIVGPPGAGKSTIATTIASDPEIPCANFFCKRDDPLLRDPSQIWRTLAYRLSFVDKRDGLQAALMRAVYETGGKLDGFKAEQQFEKLMKKPLETVTRETKNESSYPAIIIDALDECHIAGENDGGWDSFLKSLTSWSEFSGKIKLIVTSRNLPDIQKSIGRVSHSIDLSTKLDESKNDIIMLFTTKFAEIRKKFDISESWPSEEELLKLTEYAAGLFIWADTVIKYVGREAAGASPRNRLKHVLSGIAAQGGEAGALGKENRVYFLYARILLEAFHLSEGDELNIAKRCLSAVVLTREPLTRDDVVKLLSTESYDASEGVNSTLRALSPIVSKSDGDGVLRVCHKTVSDFLLSRKDSKVAMECVVEQWNKQVSGENSKVANPLSFILDCAEEYRHLALAYLSLVLRGESSKQSSLLDSAKFHWKSYRKDAGDSSTLKILVDAIDFALGCLDRFARQFVFPNNVAKTLIRSLHDAIEFCINDDQHVHEKQKTEQHAKDLDTARGNFQVKMIENLLVKESYNEPNIVDEFLRERLQSSDQRELDESCLEGTRTEVLNKAINWWESNDPEESNLLWICGAPGAGKSAIAATLIKKLKASEAHLCAKVVAKRDIASRRDPGRIWHTFAYDLACSRHAGLKGSMMEALFNVKDSRPADNRRIYELIVKTLQEQQCLSVVFVIDALDECLDEGSVEWRELLQTLADWRKLPQMFKLVVTSRDIPSIRAALVKVSNPICLATGSDTSDETKSDIGRFLRARLLVDKDSEVVRRLAKKAAGSFIWAKMIVDLLGIVQTVDRLENILDGNEHSEDVDALYANILLETSQKLQKDWEAARTILATIVLARNPLTKDDIVELIAQTDVEGSHTRLVDNAVEELSSIISVDVDQMVRIPHKSFCDFLIDHNRYREAMTLALEQRKKADNLTVDSRSVIIDCADESRHLALACFCLIRDGIAQGRVADLFKHSNRVLNYTRQFFVDHLKGAPSLLDLNDLAITMKIVFECLGQYAENGGFEKEEAAPLAESLWLAADFVVQRIKVGKHIAPKQREFAEDLIEKKNGFQIAMIVQFACEADNISSLSSNDFLRKRLHPIEGLPLREGCLEGTRVNILRKVRDWLQSPKTERNILWIVGPPGSGKSTIATTLAKELANRAPFRVNFFCNRDVPDFQDPRQIWQTLAYSLADKQAGMKAAIMRTLDENRGDPRDYPIIKQFELFIKGPLETNMKETSFRADALPYPVIIIDALDECYLAGVNNGDWKSLLKSLKSWSEISGKMKLIVTSRSLLDIHKSIGRVSHSIDLSTKLDESKNDIIMFFTTKFAEIRKKFDISESWPSEEELLKLTEYAAGLIGWADSVIKYVGREAAGASPRNRLKHVLSGIAAQGGEAGALGKENRVYFLYARILLEAFRLSRGDEIIYAKRCLVAVVLAKEPLTRDDVVKLLSTESYDASEGVNSTLRALSPIVSKSDGDGLLRVCHKTVSDFLLSRDRSEAAMEFVVARWNKQRPNMHISDPHSFILDCEEESKNLSLECLLLIHRTLAKDISSIAEALKQSDGAFFYARRFWFTHFGDVEPGAELEQGLKRLADVMKAAFSCLDQFIQYLEPTNKARLVIRCLGDTADVASRCIEVERSAEKFNAVQQELDERTTALDFARSNLESTLRGR